MRSVLTRVTHATHSQSFPGKGFLWPEDQTPVARVTLRWPAKRVPLLEQSHTFRDLSKRIRTDTFHREEGQLEGNTHRHISGLRLAELKDSVEDLSFTTEEG